MRCRSTFPRVDRATSRLYSPHRTEVYTPNELWSQNCRPVVAFERVFERVELEVGVSDGLGDFVLERRQRRQQLVEEVIHHLADDLLRTRRDEVAERLTKRPRFIHIGLAVLVQ